MLHRRKCFLTHFLKQLMSDITASYPAVSTTSSHCLRTAETKTPAVKTGKDAAMVGSRRIEGTIFGDGDERGT